jgi:hypothetical protein
MENQRLCDLSAGKALDATQEDEVVSPWIVCFVAALEPGHAALDQRHIGESFAYSHAAEAIILTVGERVRDPLLIGRQYVDRVMAGIAEGFKPRRIAGKAPEDQRRL